MSKNILTIIAIALFFIISKHVHAQQTELNHYHRSSLYSILLKHDDERQLYSKQIVDAFKKIPLPSEYNDHNLKYTIMNAPILQKMTKEALEGAYKDNILKMLDANKIGGRLVGKWFNRDNNTGAFNMELIKERGLYDASISDIYVARSSIRGLSQLEDAGEKLISHTYVLVHDIRYVDDELDKNLHGLFSVTLPSMIPIVGIFTLRNLSTNLNMVGYKVFVTSYLFKLEWNEELAMEFYTNLWMDDNSIIPERKQAFDSWMRKCKLKYIGCTTVYSGETSYAGVDSEEEVFIKVCTRSIDKAITNLQKAFDEFKVFTPLVSISPLTAHIGLKEGVDESSQFEVLEKEIDENGNTQYRRVGIVKPVPEKIWNNLYLSAEEGWDATDFGFTTFEQVSGEELCMGMLIREL